MVGVDDIRAGRWSFALAVLLVVAACDSPPAAGTSDASDRASAASNSQLQLKVVTGGDLPDEPDRIVALGPNVVETVFALGAGERVVAVTKFADHPERATELPSVGSYVQPDFESIVSREPDLVVGVTSGGDPEIADKLEAAGVPFAFVEMSTFEQTRAAIRRIGEWIGRPDRADELVGRID
ncbi:MAG: ABC transporter substrate-binding protein, partial [Bradymonadaceae bacterium]